MCGVCLIGETKIDSLYIMVRAVSLIIGVGLVLFSLLMLTGLCISITSPNYNGEYIQDFILALLIVGLPFLLGSYLVAYATEKVPQFKAFFAKLISIVSVKKTQVGSQDTEKTIPK